MPLKKATLAPVFWRELFCKIKVKINRKFCKKLRFCVSLFFGNICYYLL